MATYAYKFALDYKSQQISALEKCARAFGEMQSSGTFFILCNLFEAQVNVSPYYARADSVVRRVSPRVR
jgi:hypothetical protein